jgi:hypothetical protein
VRGSCTQNREQNYSRPFWPLGRENERQIDEVDVWSRLHHRVMSILIHCNQLYIERLTDKIDKNAGFVPTWVCTPTPLQEPGPML